MNLIKNLRRHMYIKTSPMQNLGIYCYRYGHHENVQDFMVMIPPTKVLPVYDSSTLRVVDDPWGRRELFLHICLLIRFINTFLDKKMKSKRE